VPLVVIATAAVPARSLAQGTCSSTETLGCGEVKARTIDVVGQTDCFTFTAEAGESIAILAKASSGSNVQACWQLRDPAGDAVGGDACGRSQRILPATGTYSIKVYDAANDDTGGYRVTLEVLSATASSCPAATLTCGASHTGIIGTPIESDTYRFEAAEAGEVVSITAADTSPVNQACWRLYAADGSAIGATVCGQGDRTLSAAGVYTVQVVEQNDDGSGSYQIEVDRVSAGAASCSEGTLVPCTPFSRSITPVGDNDVYRIVTTEPNTFLRITAATTEGAMSACWQLYTSAGTPVGSQTCGSQETVIAATGTYSLRVFDQAHDGTGTYLVSTETLPACPTPTPTPTPSSGGATPSAGGGGTATPTSAGTAGGTATPAGTGTPEGTVTPTVAATASSGGGGTASPTPPFATPTPTVPQPTPTGLPLAQATLDEFVCYAARTTKGTPKFVPLRGIVLEDAIERVHFDIRRPNQLCAPAQTDAAAILDSVTHLERYTIRRSRGTPKAPKVGTRRVTTALGTLSLDASRADVLLVPTAENALVQPALPPDDRQVGHYKCYKVRVTPKTPRFPRNVRLAATDGLSSPGRRLDVKRPLRLCVPSGIDAPADGTAHVLCYAVRLAKGEPRHLQKGGLFVTNDLRTGRLNTVRESELCLPAVLEP
jgi:hypothetical protein